MSPTNYCSPRAPPARCYRSGGAAPLGQAGRGTGDKSPHLTRLFGARCAPPKHLRYLAPCPCLPAGRKSPQPDKGFYAHGLAAGGGSPARAHRNASAWAASPLWLAYHTNARVTRALRALAFVWLLPLRVCLPQFPSLPSYPACSLQPLHRKCVPRLHLRVSPSPGR